MDSLVAIVCAGPRAGVFTIRKERQMIVMLWGPAETGINAGARLAFVREAHGIQEPLSEDDMQELDQFVLKQLRVNMADPSAMSVDHENGDAQRIINVYVNRVQFNHLVKLGGFVDTVNGLPRHFVRSG